MFFFPFVLLADDNADDIVLLCRDIEDSKRRHLLKEEKMPFILKSSKDAPHFILINSIR